MQLFPTLRGVGEGVGVASCIGRDVYLACGAVGCTLQWAAANILDFGKVCEVYSRIYASLCPLAGTRGGASASTRGKCIKGDVSLVCIFIGQQQSRQWVLVKFCISLLCILVISPAGVLETDWREIGDCSLARETSLCKGSSCLGLHLF